MTTDQRITEALQTAKANRNVFTLDAARGILLLAEGHIPGDRLNRYWNQFGKIWRGE
jgi:hypothetical protein